jgi:putative membrane protein
MRRLCFGFGLTALGFIWLGPLLSAWRSSVAAHMLAHMGVVAVAAPLLAVGVGGTHNPLFSQSDKRQRTSSFLLSTPIIASLVELSVVWGWHAPALRALAESSFVAMAFEQASFLAAGLFLWLSCLGAGYPDVPARRAAGAFGLLFTSIHMTLLGALLALSPRALYGAGNAICFGVVLDAGQDQQLGGVFMLMIGAAAYLAGGLALVGRLLEAGTGAGRTAR